MQAFQADVKEGLSLYIGKWFMLKCFMGGWCCFPEGWHAPAQPFNSSTACNATTGVGGENDEDGHTETSHLIFRIEFLVIINNCMCCGRCLF